MLESELETVRRRLAEMAETAADERARMAAERSDWTAERSDWTNELRQWRKTFERHVNASLTPAPTPPGRQEARAETTAAVPGDGDPILESVMAQFDQLQKEIAGRRAGGRKVEKR